MSPAPPRRLLLISNGHGEDSIGAALAARLPRDIQIDAYPTLGEGRAYQGRCTIVGPRAELASEGWRNVRHSVWRDFATGGLMTVFPGLGFLRAARDRYDRVVVIGDMMGVYGTWLTGHRGLIYLDVYKTGFGRGYLGIDRMILKRAAETVFCRHEGLAADLRARRIDARHAGNIMMETIPRQGLRLTRTRQLAVTLLPGSRAHTAANFAVQVAALRQVPADLRPDLFLALAASQDRAALAGAAELRLDGDAMVGDGLMLTIVPGSALGDALDVSDIVLAQAGTATVQAVGMGRPALTFRTDDDRASRFAAESEMFGDGRLVVPADATALAAALTGWLRDPAEIQRRGAIGRDRVGAEGAMDAIMAAILA